MVHLVKCESLLSFPCMQVRRIVADANAFARRHLSVRGRDCYFARLLRGWHSLQRGVDPQPPPGSELFRPG